MHTLIFTIIVECMYMIQFIALNLLHWWISLFRTHSSIFYLPISISTISIPDKIYVLEYIGSSRGRAASTITTTATVGNNKQQQYSHHSASVHLIYHYELFVICLLVCLLFATVGPFFKPSNRQTPKPPRPSNRY